MLDDERVVADAAAAAIVARLGLGQGLVLGLPTGRTAVAVYGRLVAATRADGLDWSGVRTFNLDEFVGLGPDADTSYRAFMERHLFDHVNVAPQHIGFLDGTAPDLEAECRRYDAAIHDAGGIDLLVLGLGSNGHIGFNEPGPALDALTHRVVLRDETRAANATWFGGRADRVPAEALSMGLAPILSARAVLLVATGGAKAAAVVGMIEGRVTPHLPASFLQLHPRATILLDSAAAAGLKPRPGPSSAGGRPAGP